MREAPRAVPARGVAAREASPARSPRPKEKSNRKGVDRMDPLLITLVSACTALFASIVGPMVTLSVAKRQIAASVISANRHKWIEGVRDMIAEVLSLLVAAVVVKAKWQTRWDQGHGPLNEDPVMLAKLERIVLARSKIDLLLNPSEPDHQRLREEIHVAFKRLQSEQAPDSETERDIEHITNLAQSILKR